MANNPVITIETMVEAPIETTWDVYTKPEYIMQWNFASEDWYCPSSENDVRTGGKFNNRMESKDGTHGFDFKGTYTEVNFHKLIAYTIGDRAVEVHFMDLGNNTKVTVEFEAEGENSLELQKRGWQSILDNFKKCAEGEA
ncbi:MAG: SRPBCC domain-containing protein [Candidatus Gracilibacteria bacterium]